MWRYRELLPLDCDPTVSLSVGFTPLVQAPQLADALGVGRVWIKNDGVSFPSLSFKDRPVAVAINKALELGLAVVGCPSTGNLANAVAAHAAQARLESWILIPHDIEPGKIAGTAIFQPHLVRVHGTYDEINRLATEAATRFGWGIVNVNLRPYYAEGSKTLAYEIAEQLGWRAPSAVVAPMAGGALVTKLAQGFHELCRLGWLSATAPRICGAQAEGCAPIVQAVQDGTDEIRPTVPHTTARSIAIGNPVDGRWAARAIRDTGGGAAAVSDREMVEGIRLAARATGIFTEPAGGVTVAATRRLVERGHLSRDEDVVLCFTGNGMKTVETVREMLGEAPMIEPTLDALEALAR